MRNKTGVGKSALLVLGVVILSAFGFTVGANAANAAAHPSSYAWSGQVIVPATGSWELDSPSGVYRVIFQGDHNLVVYHGGTPIWSSKTAGSIDKMGLYAYNNGSSARGRVTVAPNCQSPCSYPGSNPEWGNGVNDGTSSHHLNMQDDGNFVEYTGASGGHSLWASNTVGR
ncbi:hypothetical protein SAMN05444157_2036 [Frankineae bacterium MT45]|nr:hypothetical protein SAMN05444157_2036 [Frankineae bacterium MT45]